MESAPAGQNNDEGQVTTPKPSPTTTTSKTMMMQKEEDRNSNHVQQQQQKSDYYCEICFEYKEDKKKFQFHNCSHGMCEDCVLQLWIHNTYKKKNENNRTNKAKTTSCPFCRTDLSKDDEMKIKSIIDYRYNIIQKKKKQKQTLEQQQQLLQQQQQRHHRCQHQRMIIRKQKFLLLLRIVLKKLEALGTDLHQRAKQIIRHCYENHKSRLPGYENLATMIKRQFCNELLNGDESIWQHAYYETTIMLQRRQQRQRQRQLLLLQQQQQQQHQRQQLMQQVLYYSRQQEQQQEIIAIEE